MGAILIIILLGGAIAVFFSFDLKVKKQYAVILSEFLSLKSRILGLLSKNSALVQTESKELDLNSLNCRIRPTVQKEGSSTVDAFSVEICGTIHTPDMGHRANLIISILDITDRVQNSMPVRAKVAQWQKVDCQDFYFKSELGTLPNKVTVMSQWTNVARLRHDWLILPRMGRRVLQFNISILSSRDNEVLASSECIYEHENLYFGYIDLQENIERSKTLAVALAFSVSAADGKLEDSEVEFVKNWARENINTYKTSDSARQKLEKALDETVAFFRDGNILNTHDICMEIAEIVPPAQRYDILKLCLNAVKESGSVGSQKLNILRDIVSWMEVEGETFRSMMEKIIPLDMLDTTDVETILGVTSDMTGEKARAHLNREYAKWNSRVTNSDPKIQSQADQMMKLIAEARSQYSKS